MAQVLHIVNGDTLNKKLAAKDNAISRLLETDPSSESIVDHAYLATLSRRPTDRERTRLVAELAAAPPDARRAAVEDLYWSLLSSKEFLFQH